MQVEVPRTVRKSPACPTEASRVAQPEQEGARAAEERGRLRDCDEPGAESFLFDDPYWDDAFDSYHDPTLRTCCWF
jgi:hypothetical protein